MAPTLIFLLPINVPPGAVRSLASSPLLGSTELRGKVRREWQEQGVSEDTRGAELCFPRGTTWE